MSLVSTMDALKNQLLTTTLDRAYEWPPESVEPPCGVVGYPDLEFDFTYGSARHVAVYPVWVLVGKSSDRTARDAISPLLAAVPPVLNGTLAGAVDSASCQRGKLQLVTVADVEYLGIVFYTEVIEA